MTDIPATPPAAQPQLNNYEVRLINGVGIKVASAFDLPTFRHMGKLHGYIPSDKFYIEFAHVVSIEYIGPFQPAGAVSPFNQRPGLQVISGGQDTPRPPA